MRIAPELYLKRLLIGGFEKVFEFSRCFRNEGVDWSHNPEFTNLEFYQSYIDYNELIKLSQQMLELNKKLQDVSENSDKWSDIKREIEKTDKEIDGKVFELYGLGEEERKIVESNDVL